MKLSIEEHHTPKYPDDLIRAGRLAANAGPEWAEFEKELTQKTFSYIENRYHDIFSDTHKEEVCQGVIKRLKANNNRVLATFHGECTLSTYIANQIDWAVRDWLKKNSDRLFEMQVDASEEEGHGGPAVQADPSVRSELDDRIEEQEVSKKIASLREEWRWAFLLRYYYFFSFPFEEIRSLAKKRGVPIKDITQLLIKYFETDEADVLSKQVEKKEKVLESLGRIHQKMSRLYFEERSLSVKACSQDKKRLAGLINEIDEQRKRLAEKREKIRQNEQRIITVPYWVIADILGEESENTVRGFVFYARKQLKDIIENE